MKFNQTIVEIITKRRSVRTYDASKKVEQDKTEIIKDIMNEGKTKSFRFDLATFSELKKRKERLGTYGFIKGAELFMVGIMNENYGDRKNQSINFGRTFERIILKATDLGLGTCWMVSTFKRKQLAQRISLEDNEYFAIASPLGYSALKKRSIERIMRRIPKSDQRKPWKELFFLENLETPITKESTGEYSMALDMLRLSPSAANTQPWRIIKREDNYDLYVLKDKRGGRHLIDCNFNDAGIAMCHFELTTEELGLKGQWTEDKSREDIIEHGFVYVSSWQISD